MSNVMSHDDTPAARDEQPRWLPLCGDCRASGGVLLYSALRDTMMLLSSREFIAEVVQNKTGANKGKRGIRFNGTRKNKTTCEREDYIKGRHMKYVTKGVPRLLAQMASIRFYMDSPMP